VCHIQLMSVVALTVLTALGDDRQTDLLIDSGSRGTELLMQMA